MTHGRDTRAHDSDAVTHGSDIGSDTDTHASNTVTRGGSDTVTY